MLPYVFLCLFALIAAAAIGGFAILSRQSTDKAVRTDDWKKFLAAFAGTSLAISIGFLSLMMQQSSQAQQRQAEETSQIKARLLYSLLQKKFELGGATASREMDVPKFCASGNNEERQHAFDVYKKDPAESGDLEGIEATTAVYTTLFSATTYQRDALNRLLKETSLSSRIDRTLSAYLMDLELEFDVRIPALINDVKDLARFAHGQQADGFCKQARAVHDSAKDVFHRMTVLQLQTCAAYGLATLDTDEALNRSKPAVDLIFAFRKVTTPRSSQDTQRFFETGKLVMGSGWADMDSCMKLAGVDLENF